MRFVYSASCVCHILDDWNGMDTNKTIDYIRKSQVSDKQQQQTNKLSSLCRDTTVALDKSHYWSHMVRSLVCRHTHLHVQLSKCTHMYILRIPVKCPTLCHHSVLPEVINIPATLNQEIVPPDPKLNWSPPTPPEGEGLTVSSSPKVCIIYRHCII